MTCLWISSKNADHTQKDTYFESFGREKGTQYPVLLQLMAPWKANTLILILQLLPWCQKDVWLSLAWCMWATWRLFARCYKPCWRTFTERQGWSWEHRDELTSVMSQKCKGTQAAGGPPIYRFWVFWRLYIYHWGLPWLCSSCREHSRLFSRRATFQQVDKEVL